MKQPMRVETFSERFLLPREHGGWAMLAAPVIVGFSSAGGVSPSVCILFSVGALAAYVLRRPLENLVTGKKTGREVRLAVVYSLCAGIGFLPLIFFYGRSLLLGFSLPAGAALALMLWLGSRKLARSVGAEFLAIGILALGAPAAYYAASGTLPPEAGGLWFLHALFFMGPVFYVKMVVAGHRAFRDNSFLGGYGRARAGALAYHVLSIGLLYALTAVGVLPGAVLVPFIVAGIKVLWKSWAPPQAANLQHVGWTEVVSTVVFVLFIVSAYR